MIFFLPYWSILIKYCNFFCVFKGCVCVSHVCVLFSVCWLVGFLLVYFLALFACLLSKERTRRCGVRWVRGDEDMGGDDQNIWYENFIFNLKKEKEKSVIVTAFKKITFQFF